MVNEIQLRLITGSVFILFLISALWLSGDFQKVCYNDNCSYYSPNPVWEKIVYEKCELVSEYVNFCNRVTTTDILFFISLILMTLTIVPMRLTKKTKKPML